MLEIPVENNKHTNFEWSGAGRSGEGGGGGMDCFAVLLFKVNPSDDNVSKSLSLIVHCFDDCNLQALTL